MVNGKEDPRLSLKGINGRFVEHWQPKYYEFWTDEDVYQDLLRSFANQIERQGTVDEETFHEMYRWKAMNRSWHYIEEQDFADYQDGISEALDLGEKEKLPRLTRLPGIGVSVVSTTLHFIYPHNFPIIDMHTVSALDKLCGFKIGSSPTCNGYLNFRRVMLDIVDRIEHWNLRHLDRALMAYDKVNAGSSK